MKLTLDISKPPSGKAFQPGDSVNGRVQLQLADGYEAPDIQLVFQGTAKISLKPGFDPVNRVAESHKQQTNQLFTITKTLSPTLDHPTENTSLKTFSVTFSIPFPQYAECCSADTGPESPSCNLPPSTRISSAVLKASIAYTITATCRRPRSRQNRFNLLGSVQRTLTATRPISFVPPVNDQLYAPHLVSVDGAPASVVPYVRPNAPLAGSSRPSSSHTVQRQRSFQNVPAALSFTATPPARPSRAGSVSSHSPSDTVSDSSSLSDAPPLYAPAPIVADCPKLVRSTAWLPTTNLHMAICASLKPAAGTTSTTGTTSDWLPAYTPAMMLEAVMPSPPVITPGLPMPLDLFVITPQPLLASSPVVLRSLSVRLRKSTVARIGTSMRVDDPSWPLWSFSGAVPIRGERVDAAAIGSWDKVLSVPSTVHPGFSSCVVSRTYSLEISMGVSTQTAPSAVEYAKTSIRVIVSQPPPAYTDA